MVINRKQLKAPNLTKLQATTHTATFDNVHLKLSIFDTIKHLLLMKDEVFQLVDITL